MSEPNFRIGEQFGKLTVIEALPKEQWGGRGARPFIRAVCECGGGWVGRLASLVTGNTTSCGCAYKQRRHDDYSSEIGQRYGRLIVTSLVPSEEWPTVKGRGDKRIPQPLIYAICVCGATWRGRLYAIKSGSTKSCGCLKHERAPGFVSPTLTHGMTGTPEHNIWKGIVKRCHNPNDHSYNYYGGRGIHVCPRWRASFENFYLDIGPRPSPEFSIERKDNDKGYSPENCVWATQSQQASNKRNSRYVDFGGERITVTNLARKVGVPYSALSQRIRSGWAVEDAVSIPVRQRSNKNKV